jgi:hypothetical protein
VARPKLALFIRALGALEIPIEATAAHLLRRDIGGVEHAASEIGDDDRPAFEYNFYT